MAEKKDILFGVLNQYFNLILGNAPFWYDGILLNKNNQPLCYVVCKQKNPADAEIDLLRKNLYNEGQHLPLVCFISTTPYEFFMGMLLYWDYNRCIVNPYISNWRKVNPENIEWLKVQCEARRMRIYSLPAKYTRVLKTIELNATQLVEAEIIYTRSLTETYSMKPHKEETQLERFNRNITGTPQDEYPNDDLDEYILKNVRDNYPSAEIKSRLLLFDIDLLNLRSVKDKKHQEDTWTALLDKNKGVKMTVETYYYPNFRGLNTRPIVRNFNNIISDKIANLISNSYYPLSEINI